MPPMQARSPTHRHRRRHCLHCSAYLPSTLCAAAQPRRAVPLPPAHPPPPRPLGRRVPPAAWAPHRLGAAQRPPCPAETPRHGPDHRSGGARSLGRSRWPRWRGAPWLGVGVGVRVEVRVRGGVEVGVGVGSGGRGRLGASEVAAEALLRRTE
eukprot:scaffold69670_cov44-Phaeocystis_antarctica.AAC.1